MGEYWNACRNLTQTRKTYKHHVVVSGVHLQKHRADYRQKIFIFAMTAFWRPVLLKLITSSTDTQQF